MSEENEEDVLVITKADKGNSVVLLDRHEYNMKILPVIDTSFKLSKLSILSNYVRRVRDKINKSEHVIDNYSLKRSLLISNRLPPRLYGFPKLHKNGTRSEYVYFDPCL